MANIFGFTPDSALISKLADYVTIDTAQTITGEKIFDGDVVCAQDLVFGDGSIQSTAYTGGAGNFVTTNTVQTITAEKTFSSSSLKVGNRITYQNAGADCYLETTTAAQSLNIEAGSGGGLIKILSVPRFSFGPLNSTATITVNTTATLTFPFKNLYLVALGPSGNTLTLPNASAALEGTDITFRKLSGAGNMFVRQENGAINIVGPAGTIAYDTIVCMATTDSWCRIICVNSVWYAMR